MNDGTQKYIDPRSELRKSWHPIKNGNLSLFDLLPQSNKKVWWMCDKGHEWQTTMANRTGTNKTGCPYCSGKKPTKDNNFAVLFPDLVKEWHPEKNKPLNPEEYLPYSSKRVWWRCGKGHNWQSRIADRSRKKNGCPYCSGRLACDDNCLLTLFPAIAKEWHPTKNGGLTSKDITPGSDKKVWWRCREGHSWVANVWHRTGRASGCPYCSGRYATVDINLSSLFPELLKEWHYEKNKTLKPEDLRPQSNKKVWWKCSEGHEWKTSPNKRTGRDHTNCPYCAGKLRLDINDIHTFVERRGGKLLSNSYLNAHIPLNVQCHLGHNFTIAYNNAKYGNWCPYCSAAIGERICRQAFETLFKAKFPISRPKWLKNPDTGYPLQLDGYCKELNLAFEHQGRQHYEPQQLFGGIDAYESLQQRDRLNADICRNNKALLVYIDEVPKTRNLQEVKYIIKKCCLENGYTLPKDFDEIEINYDDVYLSDRAEEYKNAIISYLNINRPGYNLVSNRLFTAHSKIKIKCENGHVFETVKFHIFRGNGCPMCSGKKYREKDYASLGDKYGFEFVPPMPGKKKEAARWRCLKKHTFKKPYTSLLMRGGKCPVCESQDFKAEELAQNLGGECLGENSKDMYSFICEKKHKFRRRLVDIRKSKVFCPSCERMGNRLDS